METARLKFLLLRTEAEDALVADQKIEEIADKPIQMEIKRPDKVEKSWVIISCDGNRVVVLE